MMSADLVIFNANIHTMDPAMPKARWVAVQDGKIRALGQGTPPAARHSLDAADRLILPGFQDAHIHLLNGGVDLIETAQLYDATTLAGLQSALAAHAARWRGPMVWGAGWQCGFFGDHNLTRQVIDQVVSDRPCLIYDGNFHNACLNTLACQMAGITRDTPDPLNGHIQRDACGDATGMLREEAINWATPLLPRTARETLVQGLAAGQALANKHGITGVIDPWILGHHADIYSSALAAGQLTLRVAGACLVRADDTVQSALARLLALRAAHGTADFQLNAAKFFLDGGLENRTAAMILPYADALGGNAPLMFNPDQIAALFTALDANRFQIHVHCIGDLATRAALDGFQAARQANGIWPSLHQVAHVEVVHPQDRPRFAELGVMANMQPFWASHDPVIPDDTMAMIGRERAGHTYAFASLINAGAPWCISSDWAVTTLNPFEIIGTAVTRKPPRTRGRAAVFGP